MKFPLSWLKDHLETEASATEIAETLTDLGLEVEDVQDPAAKLAAFKLGKVVEAGQHPGADRLRVCMVETDGGQVQIVCGAPNARAGITAVVASPGDYVPGIDVTLGISEIRGVESRGMMLSERELGLSDEHEGIVELPSGDVGARYVDWLAENDPALVDPVIEIAVTPNRPDALGVRGIALDLAARGLGKLKPLPDEGEEVPGTYPCPVAVSIDGDTADGCPVFAGRVIRGVENGPSPKWLQDRLRAIGLRPISALVDITNYMTFDRCRPLHVFDVAKMSGGLRVHRASGGEKILALDEKEYALEPGMIAISDDRGPESIAGIMGGAETGCTGSTTDVFLESAYWDPVQIARTGRALKIVSDARYRFERGVDPEFTVPGLHAATRMIMDICGGEASEVVVAGKVPDTARAYRLDTDRVRALVGMEISADEQRASLEALGFALDGDMARPPSWRPDVLGEADLVEEVARIASLAGLRGIPLPRLSEGVPAPVMTPMQRRIARARRAAAALGYNECVTYSFIDRASAEAFGGGGDETRVENPISSEMSHMRPDLLPGLLQAASRNQARGVENLALFEAGPVFAGGEPGEEAESIAGVLVGRTAPKDLHGESRPVDAFDAKADAEAILSAIGAPAKTQILREGASWWHPGRHGRICLGPKNELATFGELHPRVLEAFDVKGPAVAFALRPGAVPFPRAAGTARPALAIRDLQSVERDFAFIVDADVEARALVDAAAGADKSLIESVRVFDEFSGGAIGEGKKSIALAVRLQPSERTLTDEDIEAAASKIVEKVESATGGTLRG